MTDNASGTVFAARRSSDPICCASRSPQCYVATPAPAQLTSDQADAAISDLLAFPVKVFPTSPLLPRVWELRFNLSAYDGCYVALAEAVDCVLLTADHRLARAPGPRCHIEAL